MTIEESILINADMEKVWKTFTDLTCWKDWNTVMKDVYSSEICLSVILACPESFFRFRTIQKDSLRVVDPTGGNNIFGTNTISRHNGVEDAYLLTRKNDKMDIFVAIIDTYQKL